MSIIGDHSEAPAFGIVMVVDLAELRAAVLAIW
jgi:hypothetical protein